MPKKTDPTLLAVSQSTNVTSAGDILRAQLNKQKGVYTSAQIHDGYDPEFFGQDLASKMDQLIGALPTEIGKLGVSSFETGENPVGIIDWGRFKQADSPIWDRNNLYADQWYEASFFKNDSSLAFPYYHSFKPSAGANGSHYRSDPIFNVGFGETLSIPSDALPGGGIGNAHLASIYKTLNNPIGGNREIRPVSALYDDGTFEGLTLSGIIYPADRGTVALLRIEEGQTDWLTPSTTADEVMSKVLAAINLGSGIETDSDGEPGGIFTNGDRNSFPSSYKGQYDLSELQRGTYRADHPDLGGEAIAGIIANPHAGSVRMLRDPSSLYGETHPGGNIPVLFGTEMWDFDTGSFFNYTGNVHGGTGLSEEDLNFFAYRLPRLESYNAEDLPTPLSEKGRYFLSIRPSNLDETNLLATAGGYVGYSSDSVTDQIARYRYTIKFKQIKAGLEAQIIDDRSYTGSKFSPLGSFALVHFKTEEAFERLVRDAVVPTDEDLWSVGLSDFSYNEMDRTVNFSNSSDLDMYGLSSALQRFIDTGSDRSVRQNLTLVHSQNKFGSTLSETVTVSSLADLGIRTMQISGVSYILPRTQGFFSPNPSIYGEHKENGEEIATLAFGMSVLLEESNIPPFGNGRTPNWDLPFYTFSSETSPRDVLTDDPIYDYQTLPYGRLLFNNLTSGTSVLLVGDSAPNADGWFLDSDLSSDRFKAGCLDLEYDLFSNATNADEVRSPYPVKMGYRGIYPLGDGGNEGERPPIFTEDLRVGTLLFNPLDHQDKLYSKIDHVSPYAGDFLLYHSARVRSLVQDCVVGSVTITATFNPLNKDDLAFFIYRIDGGGYYKIVQTLTIDETAFELCSGETNPYGGTYSSDYPIYRPVDNLGSSGTSLSFNAVLNPSYKVHVVNGIGYAPSINEVHLPYDSYFFAFVNKNEAGNVLTLGDFNISISGIPYSGDPSGFFNVVGDVNVNSGAKVDYGIDLKTDWSGSLTDAEYLDTSNWDVYVDFTSYNTFAVEVFDEEQDEMSPYGNFLQTDSGSIVIYKPISMGFTMPYWAGFSQRKDVSERFLDEMYRVKTDFEGYTDVITSDQGNNSTLATLLAQGNVIEHNGAPQTWTIPYPVNSALYVRDDNFYYEDFDPIVLRDPYHKDAGWVRNNYHTWDLTSFSTPEAQVGPLPYQHNANATMAHSSISRGQLRIPLDDYERDYRPSPLEGDVVTSQPDYQYGNQNVYGPAPQSRKDGDIYSYVRFFDVRGGGGRSNVTGEFTIRLIGLTFDLLNSELTSVENDPSLPLGTATAPPFSVLIQVPGKTAWLNVARIEEEYILNKAGGGAVGFVTYPGCMLSYENKVLVKEALVCVDIRVSVAPYIPNSYGAYQPILVKANVGLTEDYNEKKRMDRLYGQINGSNLTSRAGLVGIEILNESTGLNYDRDEVLPLSDYTGLESTRSYI